jgi:CDP-glycerol glycerophosphotransferase (TagB/SpsB family)
MMGLIASPELMFPTQVEWMQELIDHVAKRADLFLVIRVHPRELPNLRDKIHSTPAKRLAVALTNLPPNVKVNWPEERISLYDLLPHVDVGLNGWSSTGKEMALLGIPVVLFTGEILFYPASLNILASTKDEYFSLIDDACTAGWSFERVRQVFRWLAVEYTLGTINISDGFTYKEGARSLYRRVIGRLRRIFAYRFEARQLGRTLHNRGTLIQTILNEQPLIDAQAANEGRLNEDAEKNLILQQINILVGKIYSQVPDGASVTIDAIRKAVKTDSQ